MVDGELNRFEVEQPIYCKKNYQAGSVNYLVGGFRFGNSVPIPFSGRNLRTLRNQVTISAVPKCRVILTQIQQNNHNFLINNAILMSFEI